MVVWFLCLSFNLYKIFKVHKFLLDFLFADFDIESLIHNSVKIKFSELKFAVNSFITRQQTDNLQIINELIQNLESQKSLFVFSTLYATSNWHSIQMLYNKQMCPKIHNCYLSFKNVLIIRK